jgi:hypothetical protein
MALSKEALHRDLTGFHFEVQHESRGQMQAGFGIRQQCCEFVSSAGISTESFAGWLVGLCRDLYSD